MRPAIMGVLPLASVRGTIADYVWALIVVYTILIIVYIVVSLVFSFGARIPYNRASNAVLSFLRDVCEPYLRIFRRLIPPLGPVDISPILALLVLQVGGNLIVSAISP